MRKTIKVEKIKEEIERLINDAIDYYKDDKKDKYDHCYNKALAYKHVISDFAVDYSNENIAIKEIDELDEWFNTITHNAIYK